MGSGNGLGEAREFAARHNGHPQGDWLVAHEEDHETPNCARAIALAQRFRDIAKARGGPFVGNLYCGECGSRDIEWLDWCTALTGDPTGTYEGGPTYCQSCERETWTIFDRREAAGLRLAKRHEAAQERAS